MLQRADRRWSASWLYWPEQRDICDALQQNAFVFFGVDQSVAGKTNPSRLGEQYSTLLLKMHLMRYGWVKNTQCPFLVFIDCGLAVRYQISMRPKIGFLHSKLVQLLLDISDSPALLWKCCRGKQAVTEICHFSLTEKNVPTKEFTEVND